MASDNKIQTASYVIAGVGLIAILYLKLLPALLAGLLIFHLVEFGAAGLGRIGVLRDKDIGRIVLLIVIASIIIVGLSFGIFSLVSRMMAGPDSLSALMHTMADVVAATKTHLPAWVQEYLPSNVEEWQAATSNWLRENASHINIVGRGIGMFFTNVLFGMIIGGLVALNAGMKSKLKPLSVALDERVTRVANAFRRIVFSQIRISALNATLTGIFLLVILPAVGSPLPMAKTLVALTFIVGLLPIIGNLISNTTIFLVALGVSSQAAIGSLVFLIVIHKLEYFVNARIIGGQIRARAWELLLAMLVMEAAFGLAGLVAAPIYYAYLKDELSAKNLV